MNTVFRKFPKEQRAFINPADTTERRPDFPKVCVSTFSENIINKFASMKQAEEIGLQSHCICPESAPRPVCRDSKK